MKKFLIMTCDKHNYCINYDYIEAESEDDIAIEEYIDSIEGELWWATYDTTNVDPARAGFDFALYCEHRRKQQESNLHLINREQAKFAS